MNASQAVSLDMTTEIGRNRAGMKPWRVGYFRGNTEQMRYAVVYANSFEQAIHIAEAMLWSRNGTWVSVVTAHPTGEAQAA